VLARRCVPIPRNAPHRYLEDNLGALDLELTDDDLARIDAAVPIGAAVGDRYPDMSPLNA
jgi:diketogulonate reductase-like aldo/keto reductase